MKNALLLLYYFPNSYLKKHALYRYIPLQIKSDSLFHIELFYYHLISASNI